MYPRIHRKLLHKVQGCIKRWVSKLLVELIVIRQGNLVKIKVNSAHIAKIIRFLRYEFPEVGDIYCVCNPDFEHPTGISPKTRHLSCRLRRDAVNSVVAWTLTSNKSMISPINTRQLGPPQLHTHYDMDVVLTWWFPELLLIYHP